MTKRVNKFIIALMSVIFVSLMLEVGARFFAFLDQPLVSGNQLFEEKYFVMRHLDYSKKRTIFLLGDSTMNRAVYPDLIEALLEKQGLHVRVVNLAFDGARPAAALKLLEAATAVNIKPVLVLYDFTGFTEFSTSPKPLQSQPTSTDDDQVKSINASYMGRCVLCKRKRTLGGLLCWLEDNSIFIRNRAYLKQRILDFIKTQANARLYEWTIVKPFTDHVMLVSNLGWNPNHFIMSKDSYAVELKRIPKTASAVPPLKGTEQYYLDLTYHKPVWDYCTQNQIKFGLVWLPQYTPFFKEKESHYVLSSLDRNCAEDLFEKSADPEKNLYACVIKGFGQDMLYFNDPFHINTFGAVEVTKKLAEVLSRPPYRSILEEQPPTNLSTNQR